MTDTIEHISDLVAADYDGSEDVSRSEARRALETWRQNSQTARRVIDQYPLEHQVTDYISAWHDAWACEYDIDENADEGGES